MRPIRASISARFILWAMADRCANGHVSLSLERRRTLCHEEAAGDEALQCASELPLKLKKFKIHSAMIFFIKFEIPNLNKI
jgi:hypothetical protein